ncbi:MAG TPA: NADP-dependent oxidoreductase [Gaiellaceae bacterium]|nr:NADP-dependent oxidoreductase [Gaiellaceae bacterium]
MEGTMRALRLRGEGDLALERLEIPRPGAGAALVAVHAAGLTRDELTWPVDRLPATPSYELSGTVVETDADGVAAGDEVFGLAPFDRDGVAADYAVVPVDVLAPKPRALSHVEAAALPLAGLSAWQGLFVHGRLEAGERVAILGASGGVGHLAVQLAEIRGAHVIRDLSGPVDLLFDTAGAEALAGARGALAEVGRIVSVAEEPPHGTYFVVEPDRLQLVELARLVEDGRLRPSVDSVYELTDAEDAFERLAQRGKRGKVVLRIA